MQAWNIRKMLTSLLMVVALVGTAAPIPLTMGCGPSREDCQALCDWWHGYCFGETHDSCMEDCSESSISDVDYAIQQCIGSSASGCVGASCCLRFVYGEYHYSQKCY